MLADGSELPLLGLGVWQVPDGPECVDAVRWALELGYRHIDTAQAYGNERSVGQGLRESGVPHRLVPPPGDPAAIVRALVELVGELGAGNVAAPPPQLARFTREHMARQVAGLLERTLGEVKPSRAPVRGAQSENVQVS